jgi:hypothetical protein
LVTAARWLRDEKAMAPRDASSVNARMRDIHGKGIISMEEDEDFEEEDDDFEGEDDDFAELEDRVKNDRRVGW